MSLAKKCDRCGILYEPKDINIDGAIVNGFILISRDDQNTQILRRRYFDLCPECLNSLAIWLKNKPLLTFNEIRRAIGFEPIGESDKSFAQ